MSGKSYRAVKGTRDLLPPDTAVWAAVEEAARRVCGLYGYREIRTPIFEETELFARGVGESTDIVGKEMYSFVDKGGRQVTLRPENTAAVCRAFVEHGMAQWPQPVKLFYIGPQFRYERPQKGRYRQFHQIGAEWFGEASPLADVEVLLILVAFLRELGFADLAVLLNTVGDSASRAAYRAALVEYLRPRTAELGPDSQRRLDTNPLRILDSKDPAEQAVLAGAPQLADSLSAASRSHFERVCEGLTAQAVPFRLEPKLVRGLDYYTHTVFEVVSEGLGAQNAICGGGAYEGLVEELGGPRRYGVGFAIGEDRLIEVLPASFRERTAPTAPVAVGGLGKSGDAAPAAAAMALAEELRAAGVPALAELAARGPGKILEWAQKQGARAAVLLGEEELASGEVTIKDLASGEQRRLPRAAAIAALVAGSGERR